MPLKSRTSPLRSSTAEADEKPPILIRKHIPACSDGPVCEVDPYPRYEPGVRDVCCFDARIYRDPRYGWKCELKCNFTMEPGEVSGFLNLGRDKEAKAGRDSKFRRLWVEANGGQPRRRQTMSPGTFVGKFFRVQVGDADKRADGTSRPEIEMYSKIKEFFSVIGP
jgi:hypothetical protein